MPLSNNLKGQKFIMKKIGFITLTLSLIISMLMLSACSKEILSQDQIESRLLKIIEDAKITEINLVQDDDTAYYEGNMNNSYADYYFKLDAYTGKTLDWKRTIKYCSDDELAEALMNKYDGADVDKIKLIVNDDNSRYYNCTLSNKISVYSLNVDAFDLSKITYWEDITDDNTDEEIIKRDANNIAYCTVSTVRSKLNDAFERLYLTSCSLTMDSQGNSIYSGKFTIDSGEYTFIADAYTGDITQYTPNAK